MMLYIKYMVSLRCKLIVKAELKELDLQYVIVDTGTVDILEIAAEKQLLQLRKKLLAQGMELLDIEESTLIEKIINVITDMVYSADQLPADQYEEHITKNVNADYNNISLLFNEVKCMTIRQFININKVERVKEFLLYTRDTTKEIAAHLKYRNVAELKAAFKKNTGLPLSFFKQLKAKRTGTQQKTATLPTAEGF